MIPEVISLYFDTQTDFSGNGFWAVKLHDYHSELAAPNKDILWLQSGPGTVVTKRVPVCTTRLYIQRPYILSTEFIYDMHFLRFPQQRDIISLHKINTLFL